MHVVKRVINSSRQRLAEYSKLSIYYSFIFYQLLNGFKNELIEKKKDKIEWAILEINRARAFTETQNYGHYL